MEHAPKLAEQVNTYAADLASNLPPPVGPPTTISPFYTIANSGCTAHFFSSTTLVCNKQQSNTPLTIHMPSGTIIHSTHEAKLDCPSLPPATQHGHVVLQLAMQPLLSIGQLCDASCDVAFTATTVIICHNNKVIMSGHQMAATKLWNLDIQAALPQARANTTIGIAKPAELVVFSHAAMFSPALSTLAEAVWHG